MTGMSILLRNIFFHVIFWSRKGPQCGTGHTFEGSRWIDTRGNHKPQIFPRLSTEQTPFLLSRGVSIMSYLHLHPIRMHMYVHFYACIDVPVTAQWFFFTLWEVKSSMLHWSNIPFLHHCACICKHERVNCYGADVRMAVREGPANSWVEADGYKVFLWRQCTLNHSATFISPRGSFGHEGVSGCTCVFISMLALMS